MRAGGTLWRPKIISTEAIDRVKIDDWQIPPGLHLSSYRLGDLVLDVWSMTPSMGRIIIAATARLHGAAINRRPNLGQDALSLDNTLLVHSSKLSFALHLTGSLPPDAPELLERLARETLRERPAP